MSQQPHPLDDASRLACYQAEFRSFVLDAGFPCVGAKAAANRQRMHFGLYEALDDASAASRLCADLEVFSQQYDAPGADPVSFVAMFKQPTPDEASFSAALWRQLQRMHELDRGRHDWDASVSNDAASNDFSFSIGGRAFFVVGLSPNASRIARQAPFACLVFNFHEQFREMKQNGKYAGMQTAIRTRDIALQGDINPNLASFGAASEARQYAGNEVAPGWVCPFERGGGAHGA